MLKVNARTESLKSAILLTRTSTVNLRLGMMRCFDYFTVLVFNVEREKSYEHDFLVFESLTRSLEDLNYITLLDKSYG